MLSQQLDELTTQGYTVLSGIYSSEDIGVFRSTLDAIYDEFGRPLLTTVDKVDLGRGCVMSASGLAIGRLLDHAPELAPRMLHPEVRAVLRGALGVEVEAEVIAGVVSDHHRSMAGTAAIIEERTWHAATTRTFFGSACSWEDNS